MNNTETLKTTNNKAESPFAEHWHQLKRSKTAMAGLVIILAFILIALFAPVLAPMDPVAQNIEMRKTAPFTSEYILGTDDLGRDMLSRLIYGARISMTIGVIAVGIALFFGIIIGMISGYYGGMVDKTIQRLVDIMLAFPYILLTIVIVAVLGPSLTNAMVAIGISQIPRYIRIVRASVMPRKKVIMSWLSAHLRIGL